MPTKKTRLANITRQREFRSRVREQRGEFLSVVLDKPAAIALRKLCKATGATRRDMVQTALVEAYTSAVTAAARASARREARAAE